MSQRTTLILALICLVLLSSCQQTHNEDTTPGDNVVKQEDTYMFLRLIVGLSGETNQDLVATTTLENFEDKEKPITNAEFESFFSAELDQISLNQPKIADIKIEYWFSRINFVLIQVRVHPHVGNESLILLKDDLVRTLQSKWYIKNVQEDRIGERY